MRDLKYSDILSRNTELGKTMQEPFYDIAVLSNIITSQLNEILEYTLRKENISARVTSGGYDNILQDAKRFNGSDLIIVFWEAANLIDGLQYKADTMSEEEVSTLLVKVKKEIDFLCLQLKGSSLVVLNRFSTLVFNNHNLKHNTFDKIVKELNEALERAIPHNVVLIDIEKVLARISIAQSVDFRYYYSSKALYTISFYKEYVGYIKPIVMSVRGKGKKALIFDCDNTLWRGIVGEDGINGIEMSGTTNGGVVFEEVQSIALALSKTGTVLGLCSRNNPQDVDEVLQKHPGMKLRDRDITIKKVNWEDKASNLKAIAGELNIGMESLVFVDDSDFEVNLIKQQVPEVNVLQVPAKLHEYPQMVRDQSRRFFTLTESKEDAERGRMYKQQQQREADKGKFGTVEEYLASLGMTLQISTNDRSQTPRIAQLTQKTNQFNLTTQRYTEADIEHFITDGKHRVFTFAVSDTFGDYGTTGVCIVDLDVGKKKAVIDSLLMSCRIIGRNIELAFADFMMRILLNAGIDEAAASFVRTPKNNQVADFYDRLGFDVVNRTDSETLYRINVANYKSSNIQYIEVR